MYRLEACAVGIPGPLPAKSELALACDPRERRSQLVGQLGGEPLLMAQARGEALEQRVERCRELGELVVGLAPIEAAVEIVGAPVGRVVRHPRDGEQGLAEDPVAEKRNRSEQQQRQPQ